MLENKKTGFRGGLLRNLGIFIGLVLLGETETVGDHVHSRFSKHYPRSCLQCIQIFQIDFDTFRTFDWKIYSSKVVQQLEIEEKLPDTQNDNQIR